jgi:hypothetical protein
MPPSGIWCVISLQAFLEREGFDVDNARVEARGGDGRAALVHVLGTRGHQQHIHRFAVLLRSAEHFEVVGDFIHRERDVLVGLHLDLGFQVRVVEVARHLDHLGDRSVAADRNRNVLGSHAGATHGAGDGLTDGIRVDDGLLVHGVLGSGFRRIGVDRVLATGQGQFDQLDRRGRNIDTQDLAVFSRK